MLKTAPLLEAVVQTASALRMPSGHHVTADKPSLHHAAPPNADKFSLNTNVTHAVCKVTRRHITTDFLLSVPSCENMVVSHASFLSEVREFVSFI